MHHGPGGGEELSFLRFLYSQVLLRTYQANSFNLLLLNIRLLYFHYTSSGWWPLIVVFLVEHGGAFSAVYVFLDPHAKRLRFGVVTRLVVALCVGSNRLLFARILDV